MRSNQVALIAPMAIFGVSGIALYAYFSMPGIEGPFHDNMVPELFGFCLEGFFLVGLLTLLQTSRERVHRKELWLSLRGALRGILSNLDIALLPSNAEPTQTYLLEQDAKVAKRFLHDLQSNRLDLASMLALKKESIDALALARDMVPVAAQLSAQHMRWWIAIVGSMRELSQAQSREAVENSVYLLLENIDEFDKVSY